MSGKNLTNEGHRFSLKTFYLFAFVVVMIWGLYWVATLNLIPTTQDQRWTDRGLFGDMFGGLNALFSGLAFAGVICAILIQSHDLKIQSELLESQKDEMKRFADAQEISGDALKLQSEILNRTAETNALLAFINNFQDINMIWVRKRDKANQAKDTEKAQEYTKTISELEENRKKALVKLGKMVAPQ